MTEFFNNFWHYTIDIIPSLALGLALGALLPVCCFGSLPIACTFRKKGVPLGPVLAFLVAAPATSVTAILVTWKLMGWQFTLLLCAGVIFMGIVMGFIGNLFTMEEMPAVSGACPMCDECRAKKHYHHQPGALNKLRSIFFYAFVDMPREMGVEILIGIALAAAISSIVPVKLFIGNYLTGGLGYIFALVFGLVMYICSTASVPLACAFVSSGMNVGAGMALIIGYVSSLIITNCPCIPAKELHDVLYYARTGIQNG